MRFEVIRIRRQVQVAEFEAVTAAVALSKAQLQGRGGDAEFRSIIDSGDQWSYEVKPIS